jgi:hypothetical protein
VRSSRNTEQGERPDVRTRPKPKYALFENGNRPQQVVTMPGTFDLDLSVNAFPAPTPRADAPAHALAA